MLPPVKSAANIMREIIYNNKQRLSASMICAGWDPYFGSQIYQVNPEGFFNVCDHVIAGSGGSFIRGLMEAEYRKDFTAAEAKQFLLKLISYAIYRDASSGGGCRTMNITKDGCERDFTPYDELPRQC